MAFLALFQRFQTFLKTPEQSDWQAVRLRNQKFSKKSDFKPCSVLHQAQIYPTCNISKVVVAFWGISTR